jgi:AcrR family transcriptional regulator
MPDANPLQLSPRIARRRQVASEEFVHAARHIIETNGFQGFSLELVAREVGLRKQAVYHYFDSKESVLFEVVYAELSHAAQAVAAAVAPTTNGADAVEALLRSYFTAFKGRTRLFQLSHTVLPTFDLIRLMDSGRLSRLRPLNDLLLGGVTERVTRDRGPGASPDEARRFAFTAYMSVVGLLTMKALVESAGDPLRHEDEALLATLVATHRIAVPTRSPQS